MSSSWAELKLSGLWYLGCVNPILAELSMASAWRELSENIKKLPPDLDV